jgi:hypothetical protein
MLILSWDFVEWYCFFATGDIMKGFLITFLFLTSLPLWLYSQRNNEAGTIEDSDGDGLSDSLEAELLAAFAPAFMVSVADCSIMPAQFAHGISKPTVIADDGTIYGQAFPRKGRDREVELQYYHLWRNDCGDLGHDLDTEHVSALIRLETDPASATALYWYASAHEDTICDASHLTRAETIGAEKRGAVVWISHGKHASFLSRDICANGCGGDRCDQMEPLNVRAIVNLGQADAPMNNIAWLLSSDWPLQDKMRRSDFTDVRLARVNKSPQTDVVWANPSRRPAQAAVLGFNTGIGGAAAGARATDTALVATSENTDAALDAAFSKAGNALNKSSRNVWKALKKSVDKTGGFLNCF